MKRIRIGNDIIIRWAVLNNGQPYPLVDKDLRLIISNSQKEYTDTDKFYIEGNEIKFVYYGMNQETLGLGAITFTLIENYMKEGMKTVDICRAFELVPKSCMIGGDDSCGNIKTESVELTSDMSAFEGTFPDLTVYLKKDEAKGIYQPIGDYVVKEDLPTKVSQLQNDSLFITKAVKDLDNYYKKADTYTKGQINELIGKLNSISFEVVINLPPIGKSNVIYLVSSGREGNNIYDEWIFINGKAERIGSTDIDLSEYIKKGTLATINGISIENGGDIPISGEGGTTDYSKLVNKPKINNIELDGNKTLDELGIQKKGDYASKSEIPSLEGYAKEEWVNRQGFLKEHQDISGKLDKSVYNEDKKTFALKTELPDISLLATKKELGTKQDKLVSGKNISTINGQDITKGGDIPISGGGTSDYNELNNKPKIEGIELSGDKTLDEIGAQKKGNYALKDEIPSTEGLASEAWVNQQNFLKSVPAEYVTETELAQKGYATTADLNKAIGDINTILDNINGEIA